jgi:hypothetical protein
MDEMPPLVDDSVNAVLSIVSNQSILNFIKSGYLEDDFCKWVTTTSMKGWHSSNDLWYISNRLLIPQVSNLRENLFRLAHDALRHFGADKSYASLQENYYWLNM